MVLGGWGLLLATEEMQSQPPGPRWIGSQYQKHWARVQMAKLDFYFPPGKIHVQAPEDGEMLADLGGIWFGEVLVPVLVLVPLEADIKA